MSRWPEPGLEPAGDPRQGPKEIRNKGPNSSSNSLEDDTKSSSRKLPPFLVLLVYGLSHSLWVNLYVPLLGFSVALADLASSYLSLSVVGFYILWRGSLQTAGALVLILARKLYMEVVVPMYQAVWQPWLEMKAWSLAFLYTLVRWAWGCTWDLLRNLSHKVGGAVLSWVEGAYDSLVSFYQDKGRALEIILGSILQQLVFTLLMSCFKGFWAVFSQWGMMFRGKCFQLLESAWHWWSHHSLRSSLESCASSLSSSGVPLSRRFPGPDPSTFSWLSPDSVSLRSLVVQRDAEGGAWDCPWWGTPRGPLSTRFRGRRATSWPSGQALARQVKTACILVILLYIYGATLFIQVLK